MIVQTEKYFKKDKEKKDNKVEMVMERFMIKRKKKYTIYDAKRKKFIDDAETLDIAKQKRLYWIKKLGKTF